jgi:hypothetical protein
LYEYVAGNPLGATDPMGLQIPGPFDDAARAIIRKGDDVARLAPRERWWSDYAGRFLEEITVRGGATTKDAEALRMAWRVGDNTHRQIISVAANEAWKFLPELESFPLSFMMDFQRSSAYNPNANRIIIGEEATDSKFTVTEILDHEGGHMVDRMLTGIYGMDIDEIRIFVRETEADLFMTKGNVHDAVIRISNRETYGRGISVIEKLAAERGYSLTPTEIFGIAKELTKIQMIQESKSGCIKLLHATCPTLGPISYPLLINNIEKAIKIVKSPGWSIEFEQTLLPGPGGASLSKRQKIKDWLSGVPNFPGFTRFVP